MCGQGLGEEEAPDGVGYEDGEEDEEGVEGADETEEGIDKGEIHLKVGVSEVSYMLHVIIPPSLDWFLFQYVD